MTDQANSFVQPAIPRFDGHYDHWAMLMENFLKSKEYWQQIEQGVPTAAAKTDAQRKAKEDAQLKDLKVKIYLFQAIDRNIMETILNKETTKGIWDSMRQKYQGSTKVKRAKLQALRREFEVLAMKEGEKVNEYFGRTFAIANRMKVHGDQRIDQVAIIENILRSMTPKFDYVVCSVEESNDLDKLTIDELQSSLLVHERIMLSHSTNEEQILKVAYHGNLMFRGRGRGGYRGRGRGRERTSFNKYHVECYRCHKMEHFQYECPTLDKEANYVDTDEEELVLMILTKIEYDQGEIWLLDSGCSNHLCGDEKWFITLDNGFEHAVKLGNDTKLQVQGKGSIKLKIDGLIKVINNVYFVPELKTNMLSIGQLQEKGLTVVIDNGEYSIFHQKMELIMKTHMSSNNMFALHATLAPPSVFGRRL